MQEKETRREIVKGHTPSLRAAVLFWFVVIVMPLLFGKIIFSVYRSHTSEANLAKAANLLNEDISTFSDFVHIEPFVTCKILEIEKELKLPALITNNLKDGKIDFQSRNSISCRKLSEHFQRSFREKTGAELLFTFALSGDQKKVAKWIDPNRSHWTGTIGRTAAKILMKTLFSQLQSSSDYQEPKLFSVIVDSLFGAKFNPPLKNRQLWHVFSHKLGGKRLFVYCNFFPEASLDKDSCAGFLIAFTEDSIAQKKHLEWARTYEKPSFIHRSFGVFRSNLIMKSQLSDKGVLKEIRPFPIRAARVGSHGNKDLIGQNIRSGLLLEYPSKSIFLVSQTEGNKEEARLLHISSGLSLVFLIFAFISLFFLRQLCLEGKINLKIHSKLFLGIFAATIIPMAGFFVVATRYFDFFQHLLLSNHQESIVQDLQLLGLSIRNNEVASQRRLEEFKEKVHSACDKSENDIARLLDSQLGLLHDGYVFARSDGLLIENFPTAREVGPKECQKLDLMGQLFNAQSIRIFREFNLLKDQDYERLKSTSAGRHLLALGKLFVPVDLGSFCSQDGEFFQSQNSQGSQFRMITYNLFPDKRNKINLWGFVGFVQNRSRITSEFLTMKEENWKFFLKLENGLLTNTAIFPVDHLAGGSLKLLDGWPKKLAKDPDFTRTAARLSSGKSNESWITHSNLGIPTIFAARKFNEMPFIAISKTVLANDSGSKSLLDVIMLVLVLYLMAVISLISYSLTDVFIKPLKTLFRATSLVNIGEFPHLEYKSELELARLVEKFNLMTVGLRERHNLERFISEDATRTVINESLNLEEHQGEKLNVAVLFAHIRDFDRLCELCSPDEIIDCLNMYFSKMEPIIRKNNGVIDKYIGDAIMVVFSQKEDEDDTSCFDACSVALQMLAGQLELGRQLHQGGLQKVELGIGVAYGEVIRGKIGALSGRKDFTVIGDVVNFAARLESLTHCNETPGIMVSKELYIRCLKDFDFKSRGEVAIKGKEEKQSVYELTGVKNGRA